MLPDNGPRITGEWQCWNYSLYASPLLVSSNIMGCSDAWLHRSCSRFPPSCYAVARVGNSVSLFAGFATMVLLVRALEIRSAQCKQWSHLFCFGPSSLRSQHVRARTIWIVYGTPSLRGMGKEALLSWLEPRTTLFWSPCLETSRVKFSRKKFPKKFTVLMFGDCRLGSVVWTVTDVCSLRVGVGVGVGVCVCVWVPRSYTGLSEKFWPNGQIYFWFFVK
jgi:hypothetical protein